MQKWEYWEILIGTYGNKSDSNELGENGWELVAATKDRLYFKRPLQ